MIVIVEGIDRVGKTTLCKKLETHGFVSLKDSLENMDTETAKDIIMYSAAKLDSTFKFIEQLHNQGVNVVVDRLHLTELVYGKRSRFGSVDDDFIWELEKELIDKVGPAAMLVLVEPTDQKQANKRAGENLSEHSVYFKQVYKLSNLIKLKTNFNELDDTVLKVLKLTQESKTYDFYLASPFFRPDQVEREERIKKHLRDLGFSVFSPKEYSFLQSDANLDDQEVTFLANCAAIKNSSAVFAITDTKDMGTIWEAGYAYGIKRPIVYFAETLGDNPFNLMLAQSGNLVITNQEELTGDLLQCVIDNPSMKFSYSGVIE